MIGFGNVFYSNRSSFLFSGCCTYMSVRVMMRGWGMCEFLVEIMMSWSHLNQSVGECLLHPWLCGDPLWIFLCYAWKCFFVYACTLLIFGFHCGPLWLVHTFILLLYLSNHTFYFLYLRVYMLRYFVWSPIFHQFHVDLCYFPVNTLLLLL